MTIKEYFHDWLKVIDINELNNVVSRLHKLYSIKHVMPAYNNIFKAFHLCPLTKLKVIFLGYDPYPQDTKATGLAFANSSPPFSPSLQVLKESCIDYSMPKNAILFDNTLESWAKQGVLLLNSALTVEVNKSGSHLMLWRPFITKLLTNLSNYDTGLVYILLGSVAQTFEPYIGKYNHIIKEKHPSYYARTNQIMSHKLFVDIDKLTDNSIEWYKYI